MICVRRLDSVDVGIIAHRVFVLGLGEERVSLFTSPTFGSFVSTINRLLRDRPFPAPSTIRSLLCRVKQVQFFLIPFFTERRLGLFHYFRGSLLYPLLTFFCVGRPSNVCFRKIGVSRRVDKLFRIEKLCTLLLTVKHFLITFRSLALFILLIN